MNFWIVVAGEPLPTDPDKNRLHRGGLISELLSRSGHKVTWWSSTFNHALKKHRSEFYSAIKYRNDFSIHLLHGCAYQSNISFSRLRNHAQIAKQFLEYAQNYTPPDLILCAMPTIELSLASVLIGQKFNVPTVLDMRDMWPDIFADILPPIVRPIGHMALSPLKSKLRKAAKGATAILGITPGFVQWGLGYAGRKSSAWDRDFPLAYDSSEPSSDDIKESFEFWDSLGIKSDENQFNICFFGTMGRQINLENVIKAARMMKSDNRVKFIFCGDGDRLEIVKNLAQDCPNIIFPGWINKAKIWTLMKRSKAGLAPYKNKFDFQISYPNKPIEYFSAGLPVLSSLKGDLENLLRKYNCGVTYEENEPIDLINKITSLRDNHIQRNVMADNAVILFKSRFESEKVYSDLRNHLELIVKEFKKGTL